MSNPLRIAGKFNKSFCVVGTHQGQCPTQVEPLGLESPASSLALIPATKEEITRNNKKLANQKIKGFKLYLHGF